MHTLEIAAGSLWQISLLHINLTMHSKPKHTLDPYVWSAFSGSKMFISTLYPSTRQVHKGTAEF